MSNLPEQTAWESGIHQLEEEDRAKAGPGGVLNIQATQLANRTRWLRAQVESVEDYREYTFYKSESDPDGTITGRANTPEGKIFRVAQGLNDDLAFIYYLNDSDTAVPLTALLGRGAITSTIRQFSTLELAENDVAAGNIPDGSTTYVRSTDDTALAVEYINNAGTLEATGRAISSASAVYQATIDSAYASQAPARAGINANNNDDDYEYAIADRHGRIIERINADFIHRFIFPIISQQAKLGSAKGLSGIFYQDDIALGLDASGNV
ncbi:TPA: hypothetical protein M8I61_003808, partial [Klebsiella pneumoniae]|nr:hypothetical protein [Klebsiella pneumoniae]